MNPKSDPYRDMVSEHGIFTRWTPEAERWLIPYLEATESVGHDRLRRLLKHIDNRTSGGHAVVDVVARYQNMTRDAILGDYTDAGARNEAANVVGLNNLRWHRIKEALRTLHPQENAMAPETQLLTMKRHPKNENLLEFVMRYRRSADQFIRQGVVTKERCLQILFQKLPDALQTMMSIFPFQTATLDTVEDVVRSKLDWMAITKPGVYVAKELGDYMEIDAVDLHVAQQGGEECHNLREKIFAGNGIRFDAITNANGVMIAWKKLMDQPRFYREAERFMAGRRKKSQTGRRPRYMAVAEDASDADEDEFPFDAEVPSGEPHRDDTADDHDRLCMMDGEIERYEGPEDKRIKTPLVCSSVRPQSKPSLHLGVKLNGKRVSALIDTGATNCFVQLRTLEALGLGKDVKSCERSVTLGNGTSAPLAGRVSLKATIEGEAYPIDAFVLAGKGPALILGYRFLEENNLIIDCRARKLLRTQQTPLQCYHGEMQSTVDTSGRGANSKSPSAKKQLDGRLDIGRNELQDLMCEMRALTAQISALTRLLQKNEGASLLAPAQQ